MGAFLSRRELSVELTTDSPDCQAEVVLPGSALYLRHLLTPAECADFRRLMDSAKNVIDIGTDGKSYRYCRRAVSRQEEAMAVLWPRVRRVMEEAGLLGLGAKEGSDWQATGLNELVRVVSYPPGGKFDPHCDSSYSRGVEERSWWTLNIYLNTVLEEDHGATAFLGGQEEVSVQPEEGAGLLFYQPGLLHEGRTLLKGEKWLLRTDIIFCRLESVTS